MAEFKRYESDNYEDQECIIHRNDLHPDSQFSLVETVKHLDRSFSGEPSVANRQTLGELELPMGLNVEHVVHSWLMKTLSPLNLHTDFRARILKSAQEAVVRAMGPDGVAMDSGHIHLLVFGPHKIDLDEKTWGFFRIDKVEGTGKIENLPGHSIEFYLYIEGQ
jgi:hypothetical protein